MTRMTRPDCAIMCNLINTHTHTHRMTRMTGPDCVVMCNLINTHTHTRDRDGDEGGDGNESSSGDRNRNEDGDGDGDGDGVEGGIGAGGGGGKKLKKPRTSYRRDVGNGVNLGGKRKKRRHERVGSVAADPDKLQNSKEQGRKHKAFRASVRAVQVERVCPLYRSVQRSL